MAGLKRGRGDITAVDRPPPRGLPPTGPDPSACRQGVHAHLRLCELPPSPAPGPRASEVQAEPTFPFWLCPRSVPLSRRGGGCGGGPVSATS